MPGQEWAIKLTILWILLFGLLFSSAASSPRLIHHQFNAYERRHR